MLKIIIPLENPASAAASYDKIQVGRAATHPDALSQSGTFTNLGSVITTNSILGSYAYDDVDAATGQWHVWRIYNSSTLVAGSWSDPIQGDGGRYINAAEFRQYEMGDIYEPDGEDMSDAKIESLIGVASRIADTYVGYSFEYRQDTEYYPWNIDTRRIYPFQDKIVSVESLKVFVSKAQYATFNADDIFINPSANYIEIISIATVTYSIFPAIVALGLIKPQVEIIYTHGYKAIPQDVRDAVALTTVELLARDSTYKNGMGLLTKLVIGDTTMERNPKSANKDSGRRLGIPDAAAQIIDNYVRISIR
jgi:hypothetical protein